MKRRSFLLGTLATAVATAAPPVPAVPAAPAAPAIVPGTAMATTAPEYGFTINGGEWWSCGFRSHEEAKWAALDELDAGAGAKVGRVKFRTIYHPNYAKEVAQHLEGGACSSELGQLLIDDLAGWNEDNDYEGDFATSIEQLGPGELDEPARQAVAASMRRLGAATLAELVMLQGFAELEPLDDELVNGLAQDPTLASELEALMCSWCERHELEKELRTLDSYEEEEVIKPERKPEIIQAEA